MNIWFINHFAYGPDQSAGTRHYALSRELRRRGNETLVVASSFYHKAREELRLACHEKHRREELDGAIFQWVRTPSYYASSIKRVWNMIVFAWRVYWAAWREKDETPDVIVGSSPSPFAAFAAYHLARRYGRPFILEIRDLWPDALVDMGHLSRANPLYVLLKGIERYLYRNADAVVTVLPNSHEHIIENGGGRDKIFWIPNGVKLAERPPLEEPRDEPPFKIMYFGAHGHYNGLDTVVEAAEVLRSRGWSPGTIQFVLLGEGPYKPNLIQAVDEKDLGEFVEFRSAVPKTQLWETIQDADAFLLIIRPMPALEKGLSPNKLWDYLAAARPVIFSTIGGDALAAESRAGVAVTPGDPEALADAAAEICEMDLESRCDLGRKGRQYVQNKAEMSNLAERIENLALGLTKGD